MRTVAGWPALSDRRRHSSLRGVGRSRAGADRRLVRLQVDAPTGVGQPRRRRATSSGTCGAACLASIARSAPRRDGGQDRPRRRLRIGRGAAAVCRRGPRAVAAVDISEAIDACKQQLDGAGTDRVRAGRLERAAVRRRVLRRRLVVRCAASHARHVCGAAIGDAAREGRRARRRSTSTCARRRFASSWTTTSARKSPTCRPQEAWRRMEALTKLGRSLSAITQPLVIEDDVPELGSSPGTYDLQRFVYYNLFKCFWNDALSLRRERQRQLRLVSPEVRASPDPGAGARLARRHCISMRSSSTSARAASR